MAKKPKAKTAPKKAGAGKPKGAGKGASGGFFRRLLTRALLALALAYAALFAFGHFAADALIFPAPRPGYAVTAPDLFRLPVPGGGTVAALWLPKPGATRALLYLHGNGDDLGRIRTRLDYLRLTTDCEILAIDYPGYGLSGGSPSEAGVLRSAEAALDHLCGIRGYAPDSVALWGYSLGTGPAVHLAAHRRVGALILEAPFTSTFRTVLPVNPLPIDRFDNLALIDRVQCPLLVVHGDRDGIVPFAHGKRLFAAATGTRDKTFLPLPGTGHTDIPGDHGPAHRKAVLDTLARLTPRAATP